MLNSKNFIALGLMSGTSADGVDVAILITDCKTKIKLGPSEYYPFSKSFSTKIKSIFKKKVNIKKSKKQKRIVEIENEFTHINLIAINKFLKKNKINKNKIDVIGFHGQTISHNPSNGYSWQIGNSQKLANLLNIKVVSNFRENDIKNGGQGSPLTPIFHYYLTKKIKKKICFINLGGISNITFFNHDSKNNLNKIMEKHIRPEIETIKNTIISTRRDIHKHPELAFDELRTSKLVAEISAGSRPLYPESFETAAPRIKVYWISPS